MIFDSVLGAQILNLVPVDLVNVELLHKKHTNCDLLWHYRKIRGSGKHLLGTRNIDTNHLSLSSIQPGAFYLAKHMENPHMNWKILLQ